MTISPIAGPGTERPDYRLDDFDYTLPPGRIAQSPLPERDQSRLMVVDRSAGSIQHAVFSDLPTFLNCGDTLVLNDTRVNARRLFGHRPSRFDEQIEILLTQRISDSLWTGIGKPGKKLRPGTQVQFTDTLSALVIETTDDRGGRLLEFTDSGTGTSADEAIEAVGATPLPPYITRPAGQLDKERYQTIYAEHSGSAAAPTAGLHFTPSVLRALEDRGVASARITLHVGIGTFRPIIADNIQAHTMHPEQFSLSEAAAQTINQTAGRVVAVGTTSTRTLESAAIAQHVVQAMTGETHLFVMPGYNFNIVDALITNFHMPRSTLLVLVSAFAGHDLIMAAYHEALNEGYRFLSFGDAMLIL